MKYVVVGDEQTGLFFPTVFPEEICHGMIAKAMIRSMPRARVLSAGFVYLTKEGVTISEQESESLNLGPHERDEMVLTGFLRNGVSGVSFCNEMALFMPALNKLKEDLDKLNAELAKASKVKKEKR